MPQPVNPTEFLRRLRARLDPPPALRWLRDAEANFFLQFPHRHEFHVEAVKPVTHDDRDVEIIMLKGALRRYCESQFAGPHTLSCEAMARQLQSVFDLSRCRVLEDGENGAEVTA